MQADTQAVRQEDGQTHGEVLAVELELQPHADKQVQVEMIQQQINRHVTPAGLQKITQQLHITESVHHYDQGLHTHTHTQITKAINHLHRQISLTVCDFSAHKSQY